MIARLVAVALVCATLASPSAGEQPDRSGP